MGLARDAISERPADVDPELPDSLLARLSAHGLTVSGSFGNDLQAADGSPASLVANETNSSRHRDTTLLSGRHSIVTIT